MTPHLGEMLYAIALREERKQTVLTTPLGDVWRYDGETGYYAATALLEAVKHSKAPPPPPDAKARFSLGDKDYEIPLFPNPSVTELSVTEYEELLLLWDAH